MEGSSRTARSRSLHVGLLWFDSVPRGYIFAGSLCVREL